MPFFSTFPTVILCFLLVFYTVVNWMGVSLKVWMDRRFSLRGTGAGWIRRNIRQIWPEKTVGLLAQDLENGWIVPRVTLLLERWLWWRV